ncbi:hypothetical protein [Streptomyces sp. NPDC087538]|uniref:hypothetical protein n=1 Tax=Streptomyces sp. NPDC087538 TaxID=3365797 RepID=UPI0037F55973
MIQAVVGDADVVSLKDIMEELSLKQTAAGEARTAAVQLLRDGYQPTPLDSGR